MATTSLARQLEQLRAATGESQTPKSSVAQQGPNLLNVQLTGQQLTALAKDAFAELCDVCPAIAQFKSDIFKGDEVNWYLHGKKFECYKSYRMIN
jgi:hypothetical protein